MPFPMRESSRTRDAGVSPHKDGVVPQYRTLGSANVVALTTSVNGRGVAGADGSAAQSRQEPDPLACLPKPDRVPFHQLVAGDARRLPLSDRSVDLVICSPPYWRKRDYGDCRQIGQEATPDLYVNALMEALTEWRRVLRPTGSVFLNIGDTYWNRSLAGTPARLEVKARDAGWIVRNRIVWAKSGGMPEPARDRLANRHEFVYHLVLRRDYYYDLQGYAERFGTGANPGDVWRIKLRRNLGEHLAPYPDEIVERAAVLACPLAVCSSCGTPRRRLVKRTGQLDLSRPQAKRAIELAQQHGLTKEHIAAIQATGVSDAGKALRVQTGTGRNSARVKELATHAKKVLGGYFREFTFAKRETIGWTACDCGGVTIPGVVLDPFSGTGTTARVAAALGRTAIGVDLHPDPATYGMILKGWNQRLLLERRDRYPDAPDAD